MITIRPPVHPSLLAGFPSWVQELSALLSPGPGRSYVDIHYAHEWFIEVMGCGVRVTVGNREPSGPGGKFRLDNWKEVGSVEEVVAHIKEQVRREAESVLEWCGPNTDRA